MLERIRMSKAYACDMFWERMIALVERCCNVKEDDFCEKEIFIADVVDDEGALALIREAKRYLSKVDTRIALVKSFQADSKDTEIKIDALTLNDLKFKVNLLDEGIVISNIMGPEDALEIIAKRLAKKYESTYHLENNALVVWIKV